LVAAISLTFAVEALLANATVNDSGAAPALALAIFLFITRARLSLPSVNSIELMVGAVFALDEAMVKSPASSVPLALPLNDNATLLLIPAATVGELMFTFAEPELLLELEELELELLLELEELELELLLELEELELELLLELEELELELLLELEELELELLLELEELELELLLELEELELELLLELEELELELLLELEELELELLLELEELELLLELEELELELLLELEELEPEELELLLELEELELLLELEELELLLELEEDPSPTSAASASVLFFALLDAPAPLACKLSMAVDKVPASKASSGLISVVRRPMAVVGSISASEPICAIAAITKPILPASLVSTGPSFRS
jgi:hypothetical protein